MARLSLEMVEDAAMSEQAGARLFDASWPRSDASEETAKALSCGELTEADSNAGKDHFSALLAVDTASRFGFEFARATSSSPLLAALSLALLITSANAWAWSARTSAGGACLFVLLTHRSLFLPPSDRTWTCALSSSA